MKTTHTPGPWKTDRAGVNVVDPSEKAEYVIAFCKGASIAELTANARLIAAAPELLDALIAASGALEHLRQTGHVGDRYLPIIALARTARASATQA